MLREKRSQFLDYHMNVPLVGARKKELEVDDIIIDKHGIYGIIRHQDEKKGNYIEFIDGLSVYETSDMKIKKVSTNNMALFLYQKKYYGWITGLGRIILESISDDFPNANMFSNGNDLYVRGSTLSAITKRYTHSKITNSHSFFSIKLTPFYNVDIEAFDVKKSRRKSNYAYNMLRNLFIDIDLQHKGASKMKLVIGDSNSYNNKHWERIIKKFAKFKMKYTIL